MPPHGGAFYRLVANQAPCLVAVIGDALVVIGLNRAAFVFFVVLVVLVVPIVVIEIGVRVADAVLCAALRHMRRAVGGNGQR